MAINWQLRTLIGEYEDKTGQRLSYDTLSEKTGMSKTLLHRIGKNTAKRADLKTVNSLLEFFGQHLDRTLTTNDILRYTKMTIE